MWHAPATLERTDRQMSLFSTQHHQHMEGRALVRAGTVATFAKDPEFAAKMGEAPKKTEQLYPGFQYKGYAWGLSVDLSACVGCNACVVACQSENNIAVVGKEEVGRGRAMHWLRIDRYWEGDDTHVTGVHHQPVMCQHCEQAPCEVVCPVGATVHSSEGLNDMVYNRCVGTKYCSNNCPYKVRRFNFFRYSDTETPVLKLGRNPNVTVRTRGVMEKCTYCVQRINGKRIEAEKENRPLRDGEIVTACQQACPAGAIVFGDINDPHSKVAELKKQPHDYGLLAEINTQPRTSYLAKIRNPNPELEDG
jgi:molybdopterin-containing oxidoreductase family iron-sulfur binding subunit